MVNEGKRYKVKGKQTSDHPTSSCEFHSLKAPLSWIYISTLSLQCDTIVYKTCHIYSFHGLITSTFMIDSESGYGQKHVKEIGGYQ